VVGKGNAGPTGRFARRLRHTILGPFRNADKQLPNSTGDLSDDSDELSANPLGEPSTLPGIPAQFRLPAQINQS